MYAIIATGGKQYKVSEGDVIRVEKLDAKAGESFTFDQVLIVNDGEMKIGNPTVSGATVEASVVSEGRGKKVIVYGYREEAVTIRRMVTDSLIQKLRLTRLMLNYD